MSGNHANTGETGKKPPTDKVWVFGKWWWGGTPHQTTIESTESKRCGLLRTSANRSEKPAGTPSKSQERVLSFGHRYFPVVSKWARFVDATYMTNLTLYVAICHSGDKQHSSGERN